MIRGTMTVQQLQTELFKAPPGARTISFFMGKMYFDMPENWSPAPKSNIREAALNPRSAKGYARWFIELGK